jgi:beta-glucosidase/6-phospho-beta-glucosidase/beta-galactosidase
MDGIGALPNALGWNDSNVANMNYFLYKQDIARLAAIGIPYYSFSIAWTRVVPFGVADSPINTEALSHYDDLINTCLEYGITPIVTLNHFDVPVGVSFDKETAIDGTTSTFQLASVLIRKLQSMISCTTRSKS